MNLKFQCRGFPTGSPPEGTLEWDSVTGHLDGTAAARFMEVVAEARAAGSAAAGAQGSYDYPITDPLHKPDEFAVLVRLAGWFLPPELEPHYPEFGDPFEDDPELAAMTPAERARVQF
jgi:hypothetical protein